MDAHKLCRIIGSPRDYAFVFTKCSLHIPQLIVNNIDSEKERDLNKLPRSLPAGSRHMLVCASDIPRVSEQTLRKSTRPNSEIPAPISIVLLIP